MRVDRVHSTAHDRVGVCALEVEILGLLVLAHRCSFGAGLLLL